MREEVAAAGSYSELDRKLVKAAAVLGARPERCSAAPPTRSGWSIHETESRGSSAKTRNKGETDGWTRRDTRGKERKKGERKGRRDEGREREGWREPKL